MIPTLWKTAQEFFREAPRHYFPAGRDESFVSDDGGKTYNRRVRQSVSLFRTRAGTRPCRPSRLPYLRFAEWLTSVLAPCPQMYYNKCAQACLCIHALCRSLTIPLPTLSCALPQLRDRAPLGRRSSLPRRRPLAPRADCAR